MRKHEVALNKRGIKFAGITTTLAVVDAFVLGCVTTTQFHLFTNWNRYSGKIDASYVIRRSNATTSMWECILYV